MLRAIDRGLALISVALATLLVVLLFTGPGPFAAQSSGGASGYAGGGSDSEAASGRTLFENAGCAGCHALAAAGASGPSGPNLDHTRPSASDVRKAIVSGPGSMPSFSGKLTGAQIASLSRYVSRVAGR